MRRLGILGGLFCSIVSIQAIAGDNRREQEFAELLKQTLAMGEVVELKQNDRPFLGIHTRTVDEKPYGTAIILHDRDGYPDRRNVVRCLRTTLPQHRWNTLSVQMPLRELGAKDRDYFDLFPEAKARVEATIAYLRKLGEEQNIVVIGYGMGAMMGLYSIGGNDKSIAALVAISLAVPDSDNQYVQTIGLLEKLQLPMLDIYAGNDLPGVADTARKRKLAAAGNSKYRQDVLENAEHLFRYDRDVLCKRVYSWLSRSFADR